ncbi:uncharacterized protein LOC131955229 [Physella acuta]|uniref:uncharacterized protein LOC131955229 n=1 Tax=Physella acuta TaxID=109671 RepID=UPI0027DE5BF8|nr:uncharacterized protein LOC131955229 [Physella acuta]
MNFGTSSYVPTTSYGGNPSALTGTTPTASNDLHIPSNTNRSYVEELTSFDVRNYLPCPKHKLDIKLNFTYNDALDPYLVKDPLSMIKYESQYNAKTYQPSSANNSSYSYLKSDDFYSNGEPKPYFPRTFNYNFEQEKQKDEANKNKAKKGEPKANERKQSEARANENAKGSDGKGKKKQCKPGEIDPDHNNNFLKDMRGKFGANPERWQDCQVTNRIDELAQPKRLPCEYQDNRKSVYWITKRPPPKPECCNHTHFETSERLDELAIPKVVCGEFIGARHCCWEGEYPKPPVSDIDPRTVDWSRLASPKRKYPPNGVPIQPVKRSALKFNPTKRLCKLSEPKKVINSDKYYLWLWKKKPDNTILLKKVRRRSIDKCDLTNMRVMIRCDLSLDPVSEACRKLKAILPTIKYALDKGAQSVVIISSCEGAACAEAPDNSLDRLTDAFEQHLGRPVIYLEDCVGYQARALCADPEPGSVFLLENIGFHPEELGRKQMPDGTVVDCKPEEIEKFRSTLFGLADLYVVDSIAELVDMTNTTIGIKNQEKAYGFIIKNELEYFNRFAVRPQQPMAAVIGGKFKEKIKVVRNVMGIAQEIILGGELAMIFLKALKKIDIGSTQWTPKMLKKALKIHTRAKDTNTAIYLPSDVVVRNITTGEYFTVLTREDIDEGYEVVDIGPFTRGCYEKVISFARTILWCGEMGELADGTTSISNAFAAATNQGAWTYIADDATKKIFFAIQEPENVSHVTANGEVTSMLLNGKLPKGLAVLNRYRKKIKKRQPIPVIPSNKPVSFEIPGAMIDNGSRIMGIHDVPLEGRRVLIRVDFSVPNTKANNLSNNYRIRMTIPTIKYALRNRAKSVVIIAHQGTPSGRKMSEFSLKPICDALASLLGQAVLFVPETVGKSVEAAINQIHPGAVLMVENLRFNLEEEGVGISNTCRARE